MMDWLIDNPKPIPWSLGREKCVENSPLVCRGDTNAAILHGHEPAVSQLMVAPWPVMNMTHRVNAVLHQIDDNLLQLDPVTHRRRKIGIRFGLKENMVSQC